MFDIVARTDTCRILFALDYELPICSVSIVPAGRRLKHRKTQMQKHIVAPEAHLSNFGGGRVRLQRLRDAKIFTGWIVSIAEPRIEVRIK